MNPLFVSMYLFIYINMLSLRKTLNSTPILLRQTFIRRFFNDKGKLNQSWGKWMQKEVGGKNMRPRGVPSVKGQLAAAVFTWLLQLHLHPEYQGSVQKQKLKSAQLCPALCNPMAYYSPWNSPGQNSGVGSCSLIQGIVPTQGSNPGLPHCRWILYQPSHSEAEGGDHFQLVTDGVQAKSGWPFTRKMEVGIGTSMIPWDCVKYLLTMVTVRLQSSQTSKESRVELPAFTASSHI